MSQSNQTIGEIFGQLKVLSPAELAKKDASTKLLAKFARAMTAEEFSKLNPENMPPLKLTTQEMALVMGGKAKAPAGKGGLVIAGIRFFQTDWWKEGKGPFA